MSSVKIVENGKKFKILLDQIQRGSEYSSRGVAERELARIVEFYGAKNIRVM